MRGNDDHAFAVDLTNLWRCAAIDLPAVARTSVDAGNTIGRGRRGQLAVPPSCLGSSMILTAWNSLCDDLREVLVMSVENIYESADALNQIANTYAAADLAARTEFELRKADEIANHSPVISVFDDPATRPQIQ
jgi:hypothetical protein